MTTIEAKDGGTATIKEKGGDFEARFTGNALQEYCDENIMKQIPSYDESNYYFKVMLSQKLWGHLLESDSGSEENCDKIKGDLKDCRAALGVELEAIEELKAQIRQKLDKN